MSRSFALRLRAARRGTPDPAHPGKMLTQKRAAEIAGVCEVSIRAYEHGKRLPHPLIRRELFRIFPELTDTD